jgi:hypothetical protein
MRARALNSATRCFAFGSFRPYPFILTCLSENPKLEGRNFKESRVTLRPKNSRVIPYPKGSRASPRLKGSSVFPYITGSRVSPHLKSSRFPPRLPTVYLFFIPVPHTLISS